MTLKIEIFTSPSCPYCPMAVNLVEDVVKEVDSSINVETINIMENEENKKKATDYNIMAVPAVAINGNVVFVGAPEKEELVSAIKSKL